MTGQARERTRPPQIVALWALAIAAFGMLALATSGESFTPKLSFDGASYVALAEHIRAHWFVPPPSLNLRPPLYPAVIAVAGWLTGSDGLAAVVKLQVLAWLLTGLLAGLWVYRVSGHLVIGGLAGCLYYSLTESLFNVALVYAETLAVTLAVAAGLALTASMADGPRAALWRWLSAGLALATAYTRPVFQLLLVVFAVLATTSSGQQGRRAVARSLTPFVVAAFVGLLPVYLASAVVKGSPAFVSVTGHTLANYLGDRRLLGKFPPGFEAIEALYAARFAADPTKVIVPWWEVAGDWERLGEARTGRRPTWAERDKDMGETAAAVLSRNPGYYLRRWLEVWLEFSTSAGTPAPGRWCLINALIPAWRLFWGSLGAWSPFLILALELANVVHRGRRAIFRLTPIVTYLSVALANTALEPWIGQIRYRSQVEVFLLIALALAGALLADLRWTRRPARIGTIMKLIPLSAGRAKY